MERTLRLLKTLLIIGLTLAGCASGEGNISEGTADTSADTSAPAAAEDEAVAENIFIKIGDHTLTAVMEDNSSADALIELLAEGDITVNAHDYAGFEKVGDLGHTLPQNNEQIDTSAGDLILYQGNQFVLYYGNNSWSLTRLGRVENVSGTELLEILGDGDVTMVLSLSE